MWLVINKLYGGSEKSRYENTIRKQVPSPRGPKKSRFKGLLFVLLWKIRELTGKIRLRDICMIDSYLFNIFMIDCCWEFHRILNWNNYDQLLQVERSSQINDWTSRGLLVYSEQNWDPK